MFGGIIGIDRVRNVDVNIELLEDGRALLTLTAFPGVLSPNGRSDGGMGKGSSRSQIRSLHVWESTLVNTLVLFPAPMAAEGTTGPIIPFNVIGHSSPQSTDRSRIPSVRLRFSSTMM